MSTKNFTLKLYNRCYCCLSLRAGIFIFTLLSMIWIIFSHIKRQINYFYSVLGYEIEFDSNFPDTKITYMYTPITISEGVALTTHLTGAIGSYMKSYQLIRIYKYLALLRAMEEPIEMVVHVLKTKSNLVYFINHKVPEIMAEEEGVTTDVKIRILYFFGILLLLLLGITVILKIHMAYVAHKYERYLFILEEDAKRE